MRRRAGEPAHDILRNRLGFRVAAELLQQLRLPHARLGAGKISADIGVIGERFVIAPRRLQRDGVKEVAIGGMKIGPAPQQLVERRDRRYGLTETELRARLAQQELRLVAQRLGEDDRCRRRR
jgi:hypothetical protein